MSAIEGKSYPVLGLTGGIASGKSTAARFLAEMGALVIDADQIAHDLLCPDGDAYQELLSLLQRLFGEAEVGKNFLSEAGDFNRPALNALLFENANFRRELEAIMHPKILTKIEEQVQTGLQSIDPHQQVMVISAPLLFETGLDRGCARTLVVTCSLAQQKERLRRRDQFNAREAERRIKSQMPLSEKAARANWVVSNNATPDVLKRELEQLWSDIKSALLQPVLNYLGETGKQG